MEDNIKKLVKDNLRIFSEIDLLQDWETFSGSCKENKMISFPSGNKRFKIRQIISVPKIHNGYFLKNLSLKLELRWQANNVKVFINGDFVLEGDLFDSYVRYELLKKVKGGEKFEIVIDLVTPDILSGLIIKSKLLFENLDGIDPSFVADELEVMDLFLSRLLPENHKKFLDECVNIIEVSRKSKNQDITEFIEKIHNRLSIWKKLMSDRTIYLASHSHLDLAWLWPVSETWEVAKNTFRSVLSLFDDFSELTYNHSTPALYEWIEKNDFDLFKKICERIKEGRWEVLAGFWVEPELNLISGESIARQALLGQKYVKKKFGSYSKVAWLPDIFGFCNQLPQIMKEAQIEYFVTQKLRWNDTTQYPYELFLWESPDGSRIMSYMSAPIGEQIEPVKMADYHSKWEERTKIKESLWLPGVGDHGGGPTRDMLNVFKRWKGGDLSSPSFPKLKFTKVYDYLKRLEIYRKYLPVWRDELYLEFHRGCYTTHAEQKKQNWELQNMIYEVEYFSTIISALFGLKYPKDDINKAWKKILFNQFHDILPGTSISEVFKDANVRWDSAKKILDNIHKKNLSFLFNKVQVDKSSRCVVVYNTQNIIRSENVSFLISDNNFEVFDCFDEKVGSYVSDSRLYFEAKNIPANGYKVFKLHKHDVKKYNFDETLVLENSMLKVEIDNNGDISQILDKSTNSNVLSGKGNELQFYKDENEYWDAWNINKEYKKNRLKMPDLKKIEVLQNNDLSQVIAVEKVFSKSIFKYEYVLDSNSKYLKINYKIDWREKHILLKSFFTLNVKNEKASFDAPFGVIERYTLPNSFISKHDQAKWEVSALNWADITNDDGIRGVSILTDYKHGFDIGKSHIGVTLLRSPTWPDKDSDTGFHEFSIGIYPHKGTIFDADIVRVANCFSNPLKVFEVENGTGELPMVGSFFKIENNNFQVTALKECEDKKSWIIRGYEFNGISSEINFTSDFNLCLDKRVTILEEESCKNNKISPWEIFTFNIKINSLPLCLTKET